MVAGKYQHKKRGSTYEVVGDAKIQSSKALVDMDSVVVYKGTDGQLWVRPPSEFYDGRFEEIECSN